MQQTSRPAVVTPTRSVSTPLPPLADEVAQPADDEDDNPDAIFVRAVAAIPTQPLPKMRAPGEAQALILLYMFVLSFIAGSFVAFITYPTVTLTLVPVHQVTQLTTTLSIPTRRLAPVTLTKSLTASTTGKGHQGAKVATGTLTFYNTQLHSITLANGSLFTGRDGIQIAITQDAIIPPLDPTTTPPALGTLSVSAQTVRPGAKGNIAAFDLSGSCCHAAVVVKNLSAFTGGRDARDFQAVAKTDLDTVTSKLQQQLTKAMPQAFRLAPSEAVVLMKCTFTEVADHALGTEAHTLTVKAMNTCNAVAYQQDTLRQQATAAFATTRPAKQYELSSSVQTMLVSSSPFIVRVSGHWEYAITGDDEQSFAEQIQGDTPAEARAFLLKTGKVSRVTITPPTRILPDYYHIKLLVLIGG